ncbi:MAG: preprotein translocase subunit YajC [Streptosporangiaceae bacterium]|jgi:preprotein translocase subunit YajC
MGSMILAATTTTTKSSSYLPLLIIIVLFGVFYVAIIRPQRTRARRAQQTQSAVVPGQQVRTTAGIYGTVVSGDDRDIVLEVAPGVNIRMLRRGVMEVIPDGEPTGTTTMPEPDHHEETSADNRGDLTI